MQPGEIVVVRLSNGLAVQRVLEQRGERVRLALGRNKQARLPRSRVVLQTGVTADNEDQLAAFLGRCEAAARDVDLSEVWEVTRDDPAPLNLGDLAELYWAEQPDEAHLAGLLLHLERDDPYFSGKPGEYLPRSAAEVEDIMARRRRRAEQEHAAESLADHLASGETPPEPSRHQRQLLEHMRGFVVYGDSYTRAGPARDLVSRAAPGARDLQREAFRLLVGAQAMPEDEPLEILREEIPVEFPSEVVLLAGSLDSSSVLQDDARRDLTGVPAITIDGPSTRDRDDAVSVEPANGGYRLGIHIADAGSLVSPGGAVDREAERRMASLYLPEGKIPMLPPSMSERSGSLNPNERRAALSLLVDVTADGTVLDWEIVPSIIRSADALTYDQVDSQIAAGSGEWHEVLAVLDRIAAGRAETRRQAGAMPVRRPEMEVSVNDSGQIAVSVIERVSKSRRLVTELMILCNCLLARFCADNGLPIAYRAQPPAADAAPLPAPGGAYDPVLEYAAVRKMAPAELRPEPSPHGSLGVPMYVQATAPLRRFPDMVMQRQIGHFIRTGATLLSPEEVSSIAARADVQIRQLAGVETRRKRYWFLKFLAQTRLGSAGAAGGGDLFDAVVLEGRDRGPSPVELKEYPFRTRIQLTDRDSTGDVLTLRLHDVDLWTLAAHFIRAP